MTEPVLRITLLGCGSSGGVPRIDGDWGDCDPAEPKNRRRRCSILVERAPSLKAMEEGAVTRLLIDTSPDLREQLISAGVTTLDAVAFTHDHADQTHGIDDLRALIYRRGERLTAYMNEQTRDELTHRFSYIFQTPEKSSYPPLLNIDVIEDGVESAITGPGGPLRFSSFTVEHGPIDCAGFRIGDCAYTPDVSGLPQPACDAMAGISVWIVDALRDKPHPTHSHLVQTLDWIEAVGPRLGVLTNLHVDLDYRTLLQRCPDGVRPAYDGLQITLSEKDGSLISASSR
ncbi:MAG: MBL fold metallo-hydrolase [Pseudomonadota bacterium]